MLVYYDGRFCAGGFAFSLPDGFALVTEPDECLPCGFGAWTPDGRCYVEWEIEAGCRGTLNELQELFTTGSGMFPLFDISPILINGLPGHHVAYSYKGGQRYEIRLSSPEGSELSFRVESRDSLVTVRKLKDKGVEVFFEKENIYTLDSKGELLITIMSSLAQEESRSLSENVTWGQRKRFSDGKITLPYSHFLGYRKGPDDLPEIVPEEAVIVQKIYRLFMCGMTAYAIASQLTAEGIPTPGGKQRWRSTTINSILTNEKYKGDALLQKGFTVDFLTHKRKVNEGEVQQYYVEHSHPAIIAPEEWALVQREMERRKAAGLKYSGNGILGSRVVCGDCGGFYAPKTWHSTDKYRKVIYRCQEKYRGEHRCQTPALPESTIKERFVAALNELVTDKGAVLDDCRVIRDTLTDCSSIEQELADLKREVEVVTELARRCISENAQTAQDQEAYQQKYDGYVARYEQMKARAEELEKLRDARKAKADLLGGFMLALENLDGVLTAFDDQLWLTAVDRATVKHDGQIVFTFYNGMDIPI